MLDKKGGCVMNIDNDVCLKGFGNFVKEGRERLGLYQSDVAKMLNISQPYYSCIEKGIRNVDLVLAMKICDTLKLDLSNYISVYSAQNKTPTSL